jgi:hypothetical protein
VKIVVVENVSFDGEYRRGIIRLNARLTGRKRIAVLRHESFHCRFYQFTRVGRFLELFCGRRMSVVYCLLFCLSWVVNPFMFLFASIPCLLMGVHEVIACLRYGGRLSLVVAFCGFLVFVFCFVVRLGFLPFRLF